MPRRDEYANSLLNRPNEDSVEKTVGNFPETQEVSASALPLPTGAATEATIASLLSAFNALVHSGAFKVIDDTHEKIHDGELFTFCDEVTALADAATQDYLLTTGAKECHLVWDIVGDTAMRFQLFRDTTTSNDGSAQTIHNRNTASATTPVTTLHKTPTVTGTGTQICIERSGSGGVNSRNGGESRAAHEWVLKASTKFLLRITSLSGGGATLNFSPVLRFYEVA